MKTIILILKGFIFYAFILLGIFLLSAIDSLSINALAFTWIILLLLAVINLLLITEEDFEKLCFKKYFDKLFNK